MPKKSDKVRDDQVGLKFDDPDLRRDFRDYIVKAGARMGDQRGEVSVPILAMIRWCMAKLPAEKFRPLLNEERALKREREAIAIRSGQSPARATTSKLSAGDAERIAAGTKEQTQGPPAAPPKKVSG